VGGTIQKVQDLALSGLAGIVIQPFQSLDAPFNDKLKHAPIVHATEPILKSGKVLLDAQNNAGNRRIGEGWLAQAQDDMSPKFLDLRTI